MCGIFGFILSDKSPWNESEIRSVVNNLFLQTEKRGKDASGLGALISGKFSLLKKPVKVSRLIKSREYSSFIVQFLKDADPQLILIGQARLMTSGSVAQAENNQPITAGKIMGVHNGIITNFSSDDDVSDSALLFQLMSRYYDVSGDAESAFTKTMSEASGSASLCAVFEKDKKIILASNTGSLHVLRLENNSYIFSSEASMLKQLKQKHSTLQKHSLELIQLNKDKVLIIDTVLKTERKISFPASLSNRTLKTNQAGEMAQHFIPAKNNLKRCSRCILPITYPYIQFDSEGICNFCRRYSAQKPRGESALLELLEKYRSKNGEPDCLVGLSGGRDSCYGLHLLKTKYGMNPIAYTFDWGLTTDTSRRNQSKICSRLEIEHIIRSPDIELKRSHIRQNVQAFLKRPHLGMVPLFMAGDKEFYEYGRKLREENNLGLTVFCAGHSLEQRDFMTGFCGVDENIANNKRLYRFSTANKVKLASFYASQYLLNPAYINGSLLDSLKAFMFTFVSRDDFLYLFEYLPWEEKKIEEVLAREYEWESDAKYGKNQWRMGDGQTAFTNFIYYTVAGFSEFDNFRSNQIREGMISREEALKLVGRDNSPKWESFRDFCQLIGISQEEVIEKIGKIPKFDGVST